MNRVDYVRWIEQARQGDLDAFSRLVERFQDLATGAAFGWLGDLENARDVSQEAFLEAYVHLHQLRDPAAFPAWLRRIVLKHCDRLTRRRAHLLEALDPDALVGGAPLDADAARAAQASGLRLAVGALPPRERIVVALTYFAELSGEESAAFLELPLSSIKKHLRSARARLREQGESLMKPSLESLRPSRSSGFTELVTYFLAVRQGDHARVRDMLARAPGLVDAVQDWEPDLATKGVLPFASRATALITAIERNDVALLQILLDAGADVDGPCACPTGESPVWAATLLNRTSHLRVLLQRGADADRASAAGTLPLHVAAMRGHAEAVELLLAHGADPTVQDRHGLTPADWARINGHSALAQRLATGSPQQARSQGHPASSRAAEPDAAVLLTGIKALDLFCPLPRGGIVRVPFIAGVGMVVLIGELCERIARRPSGRALWTGFAQRPFDVADWRAEMSELGILRRVEHSVADLDASADARRDAFRQGVERAEWLRKHGHDVLLVLLCDGGFEGDVEAAFPELLDAGTAGSLTTLVVTPFPERADATWPEPAPPYAAQLRLDRSRAKRGLFPAVHPALTWSRALCVDEVGAEHVRVASAARALLAEYANHDPELEAVEKARIIDPHFASQERVVSASVAADGARALALLHYLSQPFYVAEPFTGRPGLWVSQDELLTDVGEILARQE